MCSACSTRSTPAARSRWRATWPQLELNEVLMPTREEIDNQLKLLARYRSNLQHLVQQAAAHGGEGAAPLPVVNGIGAQREQIDALKAWLRAAGVAVADEFNDGPGALAERSATPAPAAPSEAPAAPLRP